MILESISKPKSQTKRKNGDPFVEIGILAIELITKKNFETCTTQDLQRAADTLIEIFLTPAWKKELISIFPNSTYIQTSRGYNHRERSREFLYSLIEGISPSSESKTYCCFCGAQAYEKMRFYKTQIPLIGSGKFANYFPSFQNGLNICAKCALAIQFAPLLCYKAGGKPCLISSNNRELLREFGKDICKTIKTRLASGEYNSQENSGLFDEKFKSPQNALFHLAYKFGREYCARGICSNNESIVLYHIDNYNQGPAGVRIYSLPSNIFKFVSFMMNSPDYRSAWFSLLARYYPKSTDVEDLPIWKTKINPIHTYLLEGKNILWAFKDDRTRTVTMPWPVVEGYMRSVRLMNQQRIEKIREFSDKIATSIRESKKFSRVHDIANARDLPSFRNQLNLIVKDWQKLGKGDPIITFDDYIRILIPGDYRGWTEVRDLIVIRLYEKLHDILVKEDENSEVTE
jgi:CRISPR-associated protein Cst1